MARLINENVQPDNYVTPKIRKAILITGHLWHYFPYNTAEYNQIRMTLGGCS